MSNAPILSHHTDPAADIVSYGVARRTGRLIDLARGRHQVALARIEAATEEAIAVAQARNAVAATAAQADAMLGGILAALPIADATDADFRAQLKQATRANTIADIYRFQP